VPSNPKTLAVLGALLSLAIGLIVASCGPSLPPLEFHPAGELRAERTRFLHRKEGAAWLRRHYRAVVDSASDASQATSHFAFHGVRTRYTRFQVDSEAVRIATDPGAKPISIRSRIVSDGAIRLLAGHSAERVDAPSIDPHQVVWEVQFPTLKEGEILETIVEFKIPGTLVSDARSLASPDGDTGELLLSYYVPDSDVGAFQVVGQKSHGLLAKRGDYNVIGLLLSGIAKDRKGLPYARYVTRKSAPKGYLTKYATSWKKVGEIYRKELLERSVKLRGRSAIPFKVEDLSREAIETLFIWTRDRIQKPDALKARWNEGRPLGEVLVNNDLSAVDKVHLLHWLLEASGLKHELAVARSDAYPRAGTDFPAPLIFDTPLIFIEAYDLWLDPGCNSCQPGELRKSLRGKMALILSGSKAGQVLDLP